MEFVSLSVERTASYATPANALIGVAALKSSTGEVKVTLSPGGISRIISVIAEEISSTAKANAKAVPKAVQNAVDEPLLIEHAGNIGDE